VHAVSTIAREHEGANERSLRNLITAPQSPIRPPQMLGVGSGEGTPDDDNKLAAAKVESCMRS